jgi:endonuclease III
MPKKPPERRKLQQVVAALRDYYGEPDSPATVDPFELIVFENIAYLVSDERRLQAFEALRDRVGLRPIDILSASHEALLDVTRLGGMHPEQRVERLKKIAQTALQELGGDLRAAIDKPLKTAKRALMKFPAIGEPGAEKIALFSRAHKVLALESNGLRSLLRIGFGEERKSYASTYRSVRDACEDQVVDDFDWLIAAHQLLRTHGQRTCKNTEPLCTVCSVRQSCEYYGQQVRRKARPDSDRDLNP